MYRRLARWCFTHGAWVVAAWIAVLAGVNVAASAVGSAFSAEFTIPASESARGLEILDEAFPGAGGAFGGSIVVKSDGPVDRPDVRAPLEDLLARVDGIDGVGIVSPFSPIGAAQVSPDRTIAFAEVTLASTIDQTAAAEIGAEIAAMLPEIPGTVLEVGGQALTEFEPCGSSTSRGACSSVSAPAASASSSAGWSRPRGSPRTAGSSPGSSAVPHRPDSSCSSRRRHG